MLVEFSDFNLKLVILLIYPISMRIQHYTRQLYLENDNYFFYTFRYFACYTFAFIPLLIIQYRSKKGNKDITDKEKKLKEENDKIKSQVLRPTTIELEKRKTKKIIYQNIIYIGLLCILGISTHLYRNKFEKNEYWDVKQSIGVILEIIDFIVSIDKQYAYKIKNHLNYLINTRKNMIEAQARWLEDYRYVQRIINPTRYIGEAILQ